MTLCPGPASPLDGFMRAVSFVPLRMTQGATLLTAGLLPRGAFRSRMRLRLEK